MASTASTQIVAPAGRTLFNRAVMLRTFVRIDNFEQSAFGASLRRVANPYAVVWGATPRLTTTFVAPLVSMQHDAPGPAQDTNTSFGDGAVFARYDLVRKNVPGGYTRLAPEVGASLPTGGLFTADTTNPIGVLIFSHVRDPNWLVADAQFTYTTTSDEGFRQGNRWRYDVAYLRRLIPRPQMDEPSLYFVLEMNGEHVRRARLEGRTLANSGGNLIFLSPGLEFIPNRRMVIEFSFPIPVATDLNGEQMEPSSSVLAGIRWLF